MLENTWYIIANPTSGNNALNKKQSKIENVLRLNNIFYEFVLTKYHKNEIELVQNAVEKGYRNFISIGGDGTLHNIVNGFMVQKNVNPLHLKLGIIPLGTGNDWIKTYGIPKNIDKTIAIIKKGHSVIQDIGKIELFNANTIVYFNNLAGIGFDGFVVNTINKYKKLGSLSYLFGTLVSFLKYKKSELEITFNNQRIITTSLLTLVGICKFSGGGMRLTSNVNTTDKLFDISIAKNFSLLTMLTNIVNFFNGKIVNHKEVETYKTSEIKIISSDKNSFIQADGELIGSGGFTATILPQQIKFIIPQQYKP